MNASRYQKILLGGGYAGELDHLSKVEFLLEKSHRANARRRLRKISIEKLWKEYLRVSKLLSNEFPEVVQRTPSERAFERVLKSHTKRKFLKNAWIGAINVDFLFLQLGAGKTGNEHANHGIAIEIDGESHNALGKMMKDEFKLRFLSHIGIGLTSVENADISSVHSHNLCRGLSKLPRLCSRTSNQIRRRIAVETILACSNYLEFLDLNKTLSDHSNLEKFDAEFEPL